MVETITYGPWIRKPSGGGGLALPNEGSPSMFDGIAEIMSNRRVIAHVTGSDVYLKVSGPALTLAALDTVQAAHDAWDPS